MPYAAPNPITPEPRGGAWTISDPIDPRYGPDPITPEPRGGAWTISDTIDPRYYNPIIPEPRGGAWTVIFIQMPNKTSVGMLLAN